MRWGKIILLLQAFVTLVLGILFFSQVLTIDAEKIIQAEISINTSNPAATQQQADENISEAKTKYSTASYILLFISLIELIIITRLLT